MAQHTAQSAPSTAELLTRLTEQTSQLVRDEVALAKLEIAQKARSAGIGAGAFGAAGVLALFGLGTLIATAILALAEAMPAWLAALIVTVTLLVIAGIAALVGKKKVAHATPPLPEEAIESVRLDIAEVKEARHHGN
jgi:uncharacterized membrane protein YqjE